MRQITILSESHEDAISVVTATLAEAGVNIHNITADHYGHQTVIHVITDNEAEAVRILQENGCGQVMREDALLVKVTDKTGILARIARRFDEAGTPLRSIRFVERYDGHALIALTAKNTQTAHNLMKEMEKEQTLIHIKE
jgi:hypothetical protein